MRVLLFIFSCFVVGIVSTSRRCITFVFLGLEAPRLAAHHYEGMNERTNEHADWRSLFVRFSYVIALVGIREAFFLIAFLAVVSSCCILIDAYIHACIHA